MAHGRRSILALAFSVAAVSCGGGADVAILPINDVAPAATVVSTTVAASVPAVTIEIRSSGSEDQEPQPGTVVARATTSFVTVRVDPNDDADEVVTLSHPTDRGGARVFEVMSTDISPLPEWLEVRLPIRPNGTTGWIRSADVELSMNPFRLEIDTSDFELVLFRNDEHVLTTSIAVGTGDTPTPYGRFFITELLQPGSPDGPYGPFAFGLSGFSEVLTSFAGGDGVIGIHGTNQPSALGTNVSSGCVRIENDVIEMLAEMVPLGTPVEIRT